MPTSQVTIEVNLHRGAAQSPAKEELMDIAMIVNCCRRAQTTVGSTILRQVVLGGIRKLAEYKPNVQTNNWHSSMVPASFESCIASRMIY